jgi:hypothetical protein
MKIGFGRRVAVYVDVARKVFAAASEMKLDGSW